MEMRQSDINYRKRMSKVCLLGVPEGEESERELGNWQHLKRNFPEILNGKPVKSKKSELEEN